MPASRNIPVLAWIAARPGRAFVALSWPACRGLDRAAGAALPQFAARPDRGADLRPRMAARLRQAAAAALVAGRDRLPADRPRFRLLPAGADFRGVRPLQSSSRPPGRWSARSARWRRCSLSTACTTSTTPPPSSIMTSSSCRSGRWRALPFTARCAAGQTTDWLLLGLAVGLSLWAKYFVLVLAVPLALFVVVDRDARKTLATPGPYIALAAALITMAPHLIWLVRNDFLPFAYAEHRALPSRGLIDHVWHPLQFAVSQLFFLLPSLLIALPLVYPRARAGEPPVAERADAFDLRIVTLARLRAGGDGAGALGGERPRHRGDVGLSALAVPRPVDRALIARRALDANAACPPARHLGDRVHLLRRSLHRQLRGAAAVRSPLPRGVLPRRRSRPRNLATLSRRDRKTAGLCDRQHVGRRQCRALRAGASARIDRRQAATRAMDRSRRSQEQGRGGGVDRRRSSHHTGTVQNHRRRRRGATAVAAALPARRLEPLCRLGDPACRGLLTRRDMRHAPNRSGEPA